MSYINIGIFKGLFNWIVFDYTCLPMKNLVIQFKLTKSATEHTTFQVVI